MFDRLRKLYQLGKLDVDGLAAAVQRGWITEDQAHEIVNPPSTQG
ncbi:XkdX family protein [Leucobacter chironomi]|nr:XkdX family protein [Leucobacter chironomi]